MSSTAIGRQALTPQLASLKQEFVQLIEQVKQITNGLTEAQMLQPPQSGQWSIAECIVHLNITSHTYIEIFEKAFPDARAENKFSDGNYKLGIIGKLLKWSIEPPPRIRVKAPAPFTPINVGKASEVVPLFIHYQQRLIELLEDANGLALNKIKVVSPFDKRVKYNSFAVFHILTAHQRRHFWQAEQVKKTILG